MTDSILTNFFLTRANAALYQVPTLLSNISFYKRLNRRLTAGEDLSEEVPEIKAVGIDVAKIVTEEAIEEFEAQMINGWRLQEAWAKNIKTDIKLTKEDKEIYPRFDVTYTMNTKYGDLAIHVKTMGLNIDLDIDTSACGKAKLAAINEAEQQLSFAVLQG
jgi:hypothetical protein